MPDNRPVSEQYEEAYCQWADADWEAKTLEETRSTFLAECILKYYPDLAINRAEMMVKAQAYWKTRLESEIELRRKAHKLKARATSLEMFHKEQQSQEANERLKARL